MKIFVILSTLLVIFSLAKLSTAVPPHKHEKHTSPGSKERTKDGMYSPRDAHHFEDGEHHVEFDHEAIIGSVKEAEEFDSLTPEESKKRLAVLLKLMDLNHDEFIDRHELKAWILRSFKKLAEEEAEDRLEEIDQDGDDLVSWKEYMIDTYQMEDEHEKKELIEFESYDEEQKMIRDDKEMFTAADTNQNGFLDLHEFVLFQNPEEHPQMLPIVYEQTMRDKDLNNDGAIDFQEFLGDSARTHDKEWLITEKEKFDLDFDANKDGTLTGNEVLTWIVPSNDDVAKDVVDHLFATADEDHDDRLSYVEVLDNHETFVGSEATDYGDHLQNIDRFADEL